MTTLDHIISRMAAVPEPLASGPTAPLTAVLDLEQLDTMKNAAKKSPVNVIPNLALATKNGIKVGLNGAGHNLVDSVHSENSNMVNGDIRKRPADGVLSEEEENNPAKIARTQVEELERKQEEEIKKITSPERSSASPVAVPVPNKDVDKLDSVANGDSNLSSLSDSNGTDLPTDSKSLKTKISDQGNLSNAGDPPSLGDTDTKTLASCVNNSSPESTASVGDKNSACSETNDSGAVKMDCSSSNSDSVHSNPVTVTSNSRPVEPSQTVALSPARPPSQLPSAKSPSRERANLFDQLSTLAESSVCESGTQSTKALGAATHIAESSSSSESQPVKSNGCEDSTSTTAGQRTKSPVIESSETQAKDSSNDVSEPMEKEDVLLGGADSDVESVATNEEMAILDDDDGDVQESVTNTTEVKSDSQTPASSSLSSSPNTVTLTANTSAVTEAVTSGKPREGFSSVEPQEKLGTSSCDLTKQICQEPVAKEKEMPTGASQDKSETVDKSDLQPVMDTSASGDFTNKGAISQDKTTVDLTANPEVDDAQKKLLNTKNDVAKDVSGTTSDEKEGASEVTPTGESSSKEVLTIGSDNLTVSVSKDEHQNVTATGLDEGSASSTAVSSADAGKSDGLSDEVKVTTPVPVTVEENVNSEPMDTSESLSASGKSEAQVNDGTSSSDSAKPTESASKNSEDKTPTTNSSDVIDLNAPNDSVQNIDEEDKEKCAKLSETKAVDDSSVAIVGEKPKEDQADGTSPKEETAMEVVDDSDDDVMVISEQKPEAESPPATDPVTVDENSQSSTTGKRSLSSSETSDPKKVRPSDGLETAVPSTDLVKALKGDLMPEVKDLVRPEDEVKDQLRTELANCTIDDNKVHLSPNALDLLVEQSLVSFIESCQGNVLARLRHRVVNLQSSVDNWKNSSRDMMKNINQLSAAQRAGRRNARTALRNVAIQVTEARVQAASLQQQRGQKQAAQTTPGNAPTPQRHAAPAPTTNQTSPGKLQVRPPQNIAPRMPNTTVRGMLDMQRGVNVPTGGLLITSGNSPRMVARPIMSSQMRAMAPQQVVAMAVAQTPGRGIIDLTDDDEQNASPKRAANTNNVLMRPGQVGMLQQVGVAGNIRPNAATSVANIRPGTVPGTVLVQQTPNSVPVLMQQVRADNGQLVYTPAQAGAVMVRAPTGVRPTLVQAGVPPQLRPAGQQLVLRPNTTTAAGNTRQPPPLQVVPQNLNVTLRHPAPLPPIPPQPNSNKQAKLAPPKPGLKISRVQQGIVLSWNMTINDSFAEISNYQLFAYQEGAAPPSTSLWKKVGDVKALPLPMACTLTQFQEGNKYHFAVRAIDVRSRIGPFSEPSSIHLTPMAV